MMHPPMIINVITVVLLMALNQGVLGLPVHNIHNSNNIDPTLAEDRIGSSTSSASSTNNNINNNPSPLSLWFETSLPTEITPKPTKSKKPRRSSLETALGCQNFVCLLSKFDLLKTDTGYILTPLEDLAGPSRTTKSSSGKECKRFDCWLSQFRSQEKTYGWELTFKTLPEEEAVDIVNNKNQKSSSEPDWPTDIVAGFKASTSSQSNPQKSPIIDFDSLFATKT